MVTTGVLGGRWRAHVTAWGAVEPWDGGPALDWHVAADDRWHSPRHEPAVRQRRLDGTAVVETRVRIPDGDALGPAVVRLLSREIERRTMGEAAHRVMERERGAVERTMTIVERVLAGEFRDGAGAPPRARVTPEAR